MKLLGTHHVRFARTNSVRALVPVALAASMAAAVALAPTVATRLEPIAHAQSRPAGIETLHFHHVHLNSVDPKAAAAYYPKPFSTATATTFNGLDAVKTGNVYILFTKVAKPPLTELSGPQTSVWHFGWNTPNSR